jgi:hypothetical protein
MNETADSLSPEGEWYFSRDGQQSGPLTYDELKAKADAGALLPRKDLVWKEGMSDWRPVGEIQGLFDRRIIAPVAETTHNDDTSDLYYGGGDAEEWPGFGRGRYLFTVFVLPFLLNFGIAAAKPLLDSQIGAQVAGYLVLGVMILSVIVVIQATLERFANLGMSKLWFFGQFVPILNIWLGHRTIACPAGYADHKKMDGIGIFLAILYWLGVLLSFATFGLIIYLAFAGANDPEFQNKLREAFGPAYDQFQEQLKAGEK